MERAGYEIQADRKEDIWCPPLSSLRKLRELASLLQRHNEDLRVRLGIYATYAAYIADTPETSDERARDVLKKLEGLASETADHLFYPFIPLYATVARAGLLFMLGRVAGEYTWPINL